VEPTRSALSTTSIEHSGCTRIFTPGRPARIASTCSGLNIACTLQCPCQRITRARSIRSRGLPPSAGSCGFQRAISSSGMPIPRAVLRPRCWSGKKSTRFVRAKAQSSTARALLDVQTMPPWRPQKALRLAAELM